MARPASREIGIVLHIVLGVGGLATVSGYAGVGVQLKFSAINLVQ